MWYFIVNEEKPDVVTYHLQETDYLFVTSSFYTNYSLFNFLGRRLWHFIADPQQPDVWSVARWRHSKTRRGFQIRHDVQLQWRHKHLLPPSVRWQKVCLRGVFVKCLNVKCLHRGFTVTCFKIICLYYSVIRL